MTGWAEILVVALVAQLAVLPGEKVQFIIAGLSTRYKPWLVVSAAGSAFALWTAVEVYVGEALTRLLPGIYLDALTAALFVLFGVLLLTSMPDGKTPDGVTETDGGMNLSGVIPERLQGRNLSESSGFGAFVPIFAMMMFGEFGDKTQLITIGLAAQYSAHAAIWTGEMLAIIPVSIANAYFFHRFSHRLDMRKAHLFSAALFFFFAADFLLRVLLGVSVWETAVSTMARLGTAPF